MFNSLLEVAVATGDKGGSGTYIIIGIVCVVAVIAVAVLGVMSKKEKK